MKPKAGNKNALPLDQYIRLQIQHNGPMSVATYMQLCLTHPGHGYYKTTDPLGTQGDFVTSPEISQMFGEMLGTWALSTWYHLGCPNSFDLVELGPGRGTLMADALRVITKDEEAKAALSIVLLETNPILIEAQQNVLSDYAPIWIEEVNQLANRKNPKIILANEFFDALPIRQYQFDSGQWHEREIGLIKDQLSWGLSPQPFPDTKIPHVLRHAIQDQIWETCPLAHQTVAQIGTVLNQTGGAMMLVDYGYELTQTGNTFQAVQNHKYTDPLFTPGKADLSAHVDFEALARAARETGIRVHFGGTQRQALKQLHIERRAQDLCTANPEQSQSIQNDLSRLIDKDQMGNLFKTLFMISMPPAPKEQDQTLVDLPLVRHGFFGRLGGCSSPPFASLNTSKSTGDHPEYIANNRALACTGLEVRPSKLVILKQIHSADIITIDQDFDISSSPEADGMVTKLRGIGLGILTADCTPILFADPDAGIIGACHAGWQGAVSGVIANTVAAMVELGAQSGRIFAAIGPTIWQKNYEVGPDWTTAFLSQHPNAKNFISRLGKKESEHFDLPGFVRAELEKHDIAHISQIGQCTYAHPERYFSHRYATHAKQKTGRQISIIALK